MKLKLEKDIEDLIRKYEQRMLVLKCAFPTAMDDLHYNVLAVIVGDLRELLKALEDEKSK